MPDSKVRSLRHKVVDGKPVIAKHAVGGVDGFTLICRPPTNGAKIGPRSWVLRYVIGKKRKEKSFGSYPSISLADAKKLARDWRLSLQKGNDPREEERKQAAEQKIREGQLTPFKVCAKTWVDTRISRSDVSQKDYLKRYRAVEKYVFPDLAEKAVSEIETKHILEPLEKIWKKMTPSAWKIQGALRQILDRAEVDGLREGPNPARWANNLSTYLPHPDSIHTGSHQASLPWEEVPGFVQKLIQSDRTPSKCLLFHILTVARSETSTMAAWEQIDLKRRIWHRPKEIMKAVRSKGGTKRYPHDVPLPESVIDFLLTLPTAKTKEGLIFRAPLGGRLYDAHLSDEIEKCGYSRKDATPHGFRTSFKTWSLDKTNYGENITEKAMAHKVGEEVRNAYVRTELIERRRPLMNEWAKWCFKGEPVEVAKVIPIGKGGKK